MSHEVILFETMIYIQQNYHIFKRIKNTRIIIYIQPYFTFFFTAHLGFKYVLKYYHKSCIESRIIENFTQKESIFLISLRIRIVKIK